VKAYVFGDPNDPAKNFHLLDMLQKHRIEVFELGKGVSAEGNDFAPGSAYVVPLKQGQYSLIKGIFRTQTTFRDSLFYDVSSWTMPYAFNIPYASLGKGNFDAGMLGETVEKAVFPRGELMGGAASVGYIFDWDGYYAPKALYKLQDLGFKLKVATKPTVLQTTEGTKEFSYGAILLPLGIQRQSPNVVAQYVQSIAEEAGIQIYALNSGMASEGIDLGSRSFESLSKPRVMLVVGNGVSSYEAGEVWHLLDTRYNMPLTMVETDDLGYTNLSKYNVIVMVNGRYGRLSESAVSALKAWVREGNTLVLTKSAVSWGKSAGLNKVQFESVMDEDNRSGVYAHYGKEAGAKEIGGTIFEASLDLTHPLGYGYKRQRLPVFRNHSMMLKPYGNPYATPLKYTEAPLLSGYISSDKLKALAGTAGILVDNHGSGKVISMVDNPNFRAFWYGTNKLFANALFFGSTIGRGASE